jgi:hypothetical protein
VDVSVYVSADLDDEMNDEMEMKKPKNLGLEPVHPKNVVLASVVHQISCLFLISHCDIKFVWVGISKTKNS